MDRCVVLTGGGIKSAVASARIAEEHELFLVHVNFGQPAAAAELKALRALAASFRSARVASLDLRYVAHLEAELMGSVAQRVESAAADQGEVHALPWAATRGLVPVFLSVGAQCAQRVGASTLVTGLSRLCDAAHLGLSGGAAGLKGLRESVHSFDIMIESLLPPASSVHLEVPLMDLDYPQIIKLAQRLSVPLEATWTCERSGQEPCGQCEPCKTRARAFHEATVAEPLPVAAPSM